MTNKPRHELIREFIRAAGSTFVSGEAFKANGEVRRFTFNPRDFNEIKGTGKSCEDPNVFRFREVHNKTEGKTAWRSFRAERLISLKAKGETLVFQD
jgi:hypothetical protein